MQRDVMRPLHRQALQCSIGCCDDPTMADSLALNRCFETCSRRVGLAQEVAQHSLSEFEQRIQRCLMRCEDQARAGLGVAPSEKQVRDATRKMDVCIDGCAKEFSGYVAQLGKDIRARIDSIGR